MTVQQVAHKLALEYAKAQYSEYQRSVPSAARDALKDTNKFVEFYISAYDVIDPQRDTIRDRISRKD